MPTFSSTERQGITQVQEVSAITTTKIMQKLIEMMDWCATFDLTTIYLTRLFQFILSPTINQIQTLTPTYTLALTLTLNIGTLNLTLP